MAEIAIPILGLGAMYILSNQNKEDEISSQEKFTNRSGPRQRKLQMGNVETGVPVRPPVNFPVQTFADVGDNPASYPAPNTATDRYYKQDVYEKKVEAGGDPTNAMLFKSLSGDSVQKKDIKFNNMVPFFGSNVTQRTTNFRGNESILDSYSGSGSQIIHKKEQAPLFAPHENLHYAHGTPNTSDFIQSRMNPSRNMSNTKPWEEIRVGPGLNKGFTNKGSDGFNAGMEARDIWVDKTVDQLRTKTNPKITFGLGNHEGPANSIIKNRGIEGKIEKYKPDTFYLNTPDRWFTTGGQEKAQRSRAEEPLQPENRPFTTREYFGTGTANQGGASTGGRVEENYRRSTRPELAPDIKYPGQAHNLNYQTGWKHLKQNYGKSGYKSYPNSRSTTKQPTEFGIVKTHDIAQPFYKHEGGYATKEYQLKSQNRATTEGSYTGNSSGSHYGTPNGPVYNAAYNAHLNPNKEKLLKNQINPGCEPLFNGAQNVQIRKYGSTNPASGPANMPKESGNIATYGEMGGRNIRGATIECTRNQPDILTAFDNNPFTKPLNSVA